MPNYHRSLVEGGTYFFTVVTYQCQPIFTSVSSRHLLHRAWREVNDRFPFETIAICLMPEYLHCIWRLPEGDANYAMRWKEIKNRFTRRYLEEGGPGGERNASRHKRNEAAIWQRRFWGHTIESEKDLELHLDYIHYNPIKHGLVERAIDWPFSSFSRYVHEGIYAEDWVGGSAGRLQLLDWE